MHLNMLNKLRNMLDMLPTMIKHLPETGTFLNMLKLSKQDISTRSRLNSYPSHLIFLALG